MPRNYTEFIKLNVLIFLRDHRIVNNRQLNNAFRPGKNFRQMDTYLSKFTNEGLIKRCVIPELEPSNYYLLTRKGFNELKAQDLTFDNESFHELRTEDVTITSFFQKRVYLSDIHIGLIRHYEDKMAKWIPDFEFEANRNKYGINTKDRAVLAAVVPDSLFLVKGRGDNDFKLNVLRFHFFDADLKTFSKRFREWERVWANYDKLVIARNKENLVLLKDWYKDQLIKYYKTKASGSMNDVFARYVFSDYESLKATSKLGFSKLL